jgi:hypothetical protein
MNNHDHFSDKCTFELLSAYIDGEVTPSERQQVQELLQNDSQVQQLYQRLQRLHEGFQTLPIPEPECSPESIAHRVFAQIDQQRKRRKTLIWGGTAIAALIVTAVGSIFSGENSPSFRFANQEPKEELVIALNRPPVDIVIDQSMEETEPLMIPLGYSLIEMPQSEF